MTSIRFHLIFSENKIKRCNVIRNLQQSARGIKGDKAFRLFTPIDQYIVSHVVHSLNVFTRKTTLGLQMHFLCKT